MSTLAFSRAVSILVCSLGIAAALVGDAASQGSSRPLVSKAQYEAWQTELSNWDAGGRTIHWERSISSLPPSAWRRWRW